MADSERQEHQSGQSIVCYRLTILELSLPPLLSLDPPVMVVARGRASGA